ncbi:MAG: hypothetical protein ACOCQ4_02390 [bacterium]
MDSVLYKPFIKRPFTQPEPAMCLPTAIKVVFDNQFPDKNISIRKINALCNYNGKYQYGVAAERIKDDLSPYLTKNHKLNVFFTEGNKISDLYALLERGIYPIVQFHLNDYHNWNDGDSETEIFSDDEPNLHSLIVVEINYPEERISLYDPIYNKYMNYSDLDKIYKPISFLTFTRCWVSSTLHYPCIWLDNLSRTKKIKKNKLQNPDNQTALNDFNK